MKLLHTADIHLGRHLYGRRRHHEFAAFLDWLAATLDAEHIDALVIAGDIFDTATPSPRSQAQYYQFLCRIAAGNCRHIIITAGNHDSPAFLDAPRDILRA
ncbi:exonuclease subunit SbcD, partial [Cardiobacterium hominis]